MSMSVATIDSPEFINVTPYNPLFSKCEIKVLYVGQNRNRSYITKEVATQMANSLPGSPIVGYYSKEKEDFRDHGERITINGDGIQVDCDTVPYGFVSPDTKVWFQKFEDTDDFGNSEIREYLMATGYLWTGQFEECKKVVEEGRPHSMELDSDSLDGSWSYDKKTGMDFFIINDAIFSKLCILGEDVEPCFEGSAVSAPDISTTFSKENKFTRTMFSMMKEFKETLEGGANIVESNTETLEQVNEFAEKEKEKEKQDKTEKEDKDKNEKFTEAVVESVENPESDFAKEKDKKEEKEKNAETEEKESKDDEKEAKKKDKEDEKEKKYSLLEESFNDLQARYSELETRYSALDEKCAILEKEHQEIELNKKKAMIDKFSMLDEEDKKDIQDNIEKYSLEEIESKLSVICVRKQVNFDLANSKKNDNKIEKDSITTFNLKDAEADVPAWVLAARKVQNRYN